MNTTSTAAGDFIRVSAAKAKYFGGAMSLRWWYKQIETGRLPHHRAGATVLLRPADVEAFVAETYRDKGAADEEPEPPAPVPVSKSRSTPRRGGLRFFGSESRHD
ncbi:MAG: helix-turn-helix domain-containing protein [Gemmataceae bacterium]|nr:helix-turn-helix domain-containing protein [Gemmataceae bacterium]